MLITLFLNSCNEKEFREELKFVNSILENPENIQHIIESSPFYDSDLFNLHGNTFDELIRYLSSDDKTKVSIEGFGKPIISLNKKNSKDSEKINDAKVIYIKKNGMSYILLFVFREYNGKSKLVGITIGSV